MGIYRMNSNGAGGKELLLPAETSDQGTWPTSWSPDGRFILYETKNPNNISDVRVLPLAGDRKPRLFVHNAFVGQFSPDGRWVAYSSAESGTQHVYVVPFDATKVLDTQPGSLTSLADSYRVQISTSVGVIARWRGDGKEIFYLGKGEMMAAEVDGRGNTFQAGKEQALFKLPEGVSGLYDVDPYGKRFVMATQKVNPNTPLTLVQNWTALLGNKP
jgi:Tol biopolymer transport system component